MAEVAGPSNSVAVLAQISHGTNHHHSPVLRARLLEAVGEVEVEGIAVVAAGAVGSPVEVDRERSFMRITPSVRLIDLGFVGTCTSILQIQSDFFVYYHHVYTIFPNERTSSYIIFMPWVCRV